MAIHELQILGSTIGKPMAFFESYLKLFIITEKDTYFAASKK